MGKGEDYLPPPNEPPLREEPELLDRPKPPKELGLLLGAAEVDDLLDAELEEPLNERCETVGLERTLALAAVFWAFGESAGWEMTGLEDLFTDAPAVREVMLPA